MQGWAQPTRKQVRGAVRACVRGRVRFVADQWPMRTCFAGNVPEPASPTPQPQLLKQQQQQPEAPPGCLHCSIKGQRHKVWEAGSASFAFRNGSLRSARMSLLPPTALGLSCGLLLLCSTPLHPANPVSESLRGAFRSL